MDLVVPKNSLAVDLRFAQILTDIESRLLKLPNFTKYRGDIEFVRYCCELCEATVVKSDGINKKELVVGILTKLFNLSEAEIKTVEAQIDFIWANHNIAKVKVSHVVFHAVTEWLKKKFL